MSSWPTPDWESQGDHSMSPQQDDEPEIVSNSPSPQVSTHKYKHKHTPLHRARLHAPVGEPGTLISQPQWIELATKLAFAVFTNCVKLLEE